MSTAEKRAATMGSPIPAAEEAAVVVAVSEPGVVAVATAATEVTVTPEAPACAKAPVRPLANSAAEAAPTAVEAAVASAAVIPVVSKVTIRSLLAPRVVSCRPRRLPHAKALVVVEPAGPLAAENASVK